MARNEGKMRTIIKGYTNYSVDENGVIINEKNNTEKKFSLSNCGYLIVDLFSKGKRSTLLVHRIVAETFIENHERKRTVNHIDGNKLNNVLSNLEWATHSENHLHSYRELGRKAFMTNRFGKLNHKSKPILMLSKDNKLEKSFDSIMEAERETGILNTSIVNCLKGKSKSAGGHLWRYDNATHDQV